MSNIDFISKINLLKKHLTLVKETRTEYHFICPVCGNNNLKLSKQKGLINCFSGCSFSSLVSYLKRIGILKEDPYTPINPFKSSFIVNKPVLNFFIQKSSKCFINKYNCNIVDDIKITTYYYSSFQRILRYDFNDERKKIIIPQIFLNNKWINGKQGHYDFFYINELQSNVIVVEGEKTVCYVSNITSLPILCCYDNNTLIDNINHHNINQLLYIYDNDVTGLNKAKSFQKICNSYNIRCNIINTFSLFPVEHSGDLGDVNQKDLLTLQNTINSLYNN